MATGVTVRNINIAVKVDAKSAIAQLERVEKALSGLKSASAAVEALKKSAADIKKYMSGVNKSASAAAKSVAELKKASDGAGKASGTLNKKTKQAKSSLDGLRKTIGKLLLYRAIRQTLMMIGNAFREGLKYVKEFTNSTKNTQFSDMFSSYTEMGTSLKATLGVSLASILDALEPVALGLATALSFLADAFNQFFGAIANGGKYMKVNTAYVEQYSKSIKEAKNQVMGFDELNKLSGAELDYSQLYVESDVSAGMVALGAAITAALAAMAGEGIADFIKKLTGAKSAVSSLTSAMTGKNDAINDETTALAKDTVAVTEVAKAASTVAVPAIVGLAGVLENNPLKIPTSEPVAALEELASESEYAKSAYEALQKYLDENGLSVETASAVDSIKNVSDAIDGVSESVSDLQKYLDENPIRIGIKVGDEDVDASPADAGAAVKSISDATLAFKEAALDPGSAVSSYDSSKDELWNLQRGFIKPSTESSGSQLETPEWLKSIREKLLLAGIDKITDIATMQNGLTKAIEESDEAQTVIEKFFEGIANGVRTFSSVFGFGGVRGNLYANGGYPSAGSMFIAGEAGPEIVGSINGKTGVASGDEVTGIRTAVYSIGEAIVSAINNKDTNAVVRLDDGSIYKASQRGAKRVGNSLISFAN